MTSRRIAALLLLVCPLTSAAFASDQIESCSPFSSGALVLHENRDSIGSEITANGKMGPVIYPTG